LKPIRPVAQNTTILGDFNWDALTKTMLLSVSLQKKGFSQMVTRPTHRLGNCLDHDLVKDIYIHPCYYSDHDAICIILNDNKYKKSMSTTLRVSLQQMFPVSLIITHQSSFHAHVRHAK
jgi:hypothetical protein